MKETLYVENYGGSNQVDSGSLIPSGRNSFKYQAHISNSYLIKNRTLSAYQKFDLEYKINMQFMSWAKIERNMREKATTFALRLNQKEQAEEQTRNSIELFNSIDNILHYTLTVNDAIDWNTLKDSGEFYLPKPPRKRDEKIREWEIEHKLILDAVPVAPNAQSYTPILSFWERLISKKRKSKENYCASEYEKDYQNWLNKCAVTKQNNQEKQEDYLNRRAQIDKWWTNKDNDSLVNWERDKNIYLANRAAHNESVDHFKSNYENGSKEAIEEYCEMVLNNSVYPDFLSKDFEIEYNSINKTLIIEYQLPSIDNFPKVKEYRFITSKNEIREIELSQTELNRIYDKALYDIVLRTIHEVFEADIANHLEAVVLNGWVNRIDRSTGNAVNACIVSIHVQKECFLAITLQNVDSKECFKGLKGISGSKLHTTTPIQPVIHLKKEDSRFVEANNVIHNISDSTNLAAMDWEEFEHLIREIFEKEFSLNGGEVKVTQASRDGGVDAIAFDPDPIRGGKIVIQAKRYTNTVGVSAVRDLYGTVMNEGATKGILVTTADFGPDAYTFVKDKPLTLMNGANLLYLLEKHGTHACIDTKEAKCMREK